MEVGIVHCMLHHLDLLPLCGLRRCCIQRQEDVILLRITEADEVQENIYEVLGWSIDGG